MKSWKFPILEVPSVTSFQETKKLIGWNFIGYTYFFSIKQHQRKGSNFRLTAVIHKTTLKITHPRQTMLAGSEWFLPLYHCQVDIHLELISQIPLVVAVVVLVLWLLVAQSRRMTLWHLLFLFFFLCPYLFQEEEASVPCRARRTVLRLNKIYLLFYKDLDSQPGQLDNRDKKNTLPVPGTSARYQVPGTSSTTVV